MTDGAPLDRVTTELGLAVELLDTYVDGPPRGRPRVTVTNADFEFRRTPGGFFVLVDLPDEPEPLDVVVESDRYLREELRVDRSSLDVADVTDRYRPEGWTDDHPPLDPDEPLVTVELVPAPAYRFGGGVTMVRGTVEEADAPVTGAAISYLEGGAVTWTDADGEFALPIADFEPDDVATDDEDGRLLEPGGQSPTVRATHPDGRTAEADVTIPVGGTASAHLEF